MLSQTVSAQSSRLTARIHDSVTRCVLAACAGLKKAEIAHSRTSPNNARMCAKFLELEDSRLVNMPTFSRSLVSRIKSRLRPLLLPRRFHAFGVGMPKTGTHSLAAVFERYRALHEPERIHFMQLIMARTNGEWSD